MRTRAVTGHAGAMATLVSIAVAMSAAACGSKASPPDPAACRAACEHVMALAIADIERSGKLMGEGGAEMVADLKAKAAASRESDLQTCEKQCAAGKLATGCALQATTLDGAMACTNRRGR